MGCCCLFWLASGAQNNDIFKGGSGDGHFRSVHLQNSSAIWKGGSSDGYSSFGYIQQSFSLWKGGEGDGFASNSYKQKVTNVFTGGSGDGHSQNGYIASSNNLWKGGPGDGFADSGYIQVSENFWKGGGGDGWASTYIPTRLLPVMLLSFDAEKYQSNFSRLIWKTSSEINTHHFDIERSIDAIHFTQVGSVNSAGNSSVLKTYMYTDKSPNAGFNYYRLKQVDVNGKYVYTPSRLVIFDVIKSNIQIYPQPASNYIMIGLAQSNFADNLVINIIDLKGKVVRHLRVPSNSATQVRINVSALPRAVYIVHISSTGYSSSSKIVLQ